MSGDKDSSIIIMNKTDYETKIQIMIEEGIRDGKYTPTDDTIMKDLNSFQYFLRKYFKNSPFYNNIFPSYNQPARFFATAKTHKFNNLSEITIHNLPLRPIINQIDTVYYNSAKILSNYLKPISYNKYTINITQVFPKMHSKLLPLQLDEEDVSFDIENLFTNIPIEDTIKYISDQIYIKNKLPQIFEKKVFEKLLNKVTRENRFSVNGKLYKQVDGVTIGGPLSVVFANCFFNKMGNEVVNPAKPIFYCRYVDDTYIRKKKLDNTL